MKKSKTIRRCEIVTNLEKDGQKLFDLKNMEKVLSERTCIDQYCYIVHDKDTYTEAEEKRNPAHKAGQLKASHIHLAMKFNQPQHMDCIAKWFGVPENFVQKIHGKWEDACLYQIHANAPDKYQYSPEAVTCNFDFQKLLDSEDKKGELDRVIDRILNGEIREYNRTLEIDHRLLVYCSRPIEQAFKVRQEYLEATQQERHMECIYITGPSSVGKTTLAKEIAKAMGLSFFVSSGSRDIMDGYRQQDCLIVDEIRPSSMGLSDLLKMLDPHTVSLVNSRYKNKYLNCKLVILTSVLNLDEFYKRVFSEQEEPITQLKRRCKVYIRTYADQLLTYVWDNKALKYVGPVVYKNTVLEGLIPEKEQTMEDVMKHISGLIPFLKLDEQIIEGDTFHLEPVPTDLGLAEEDTAQGIEEEISDDEFYKLMPQNN